MKIIYLLNFYLLINYLGFTQETLGSLTEYEYQGYNHSGWLTEDGNTYVFADENHGYKMKICDVSNPSDISVTTTLLSEVSDESMAHNLIIKDNFLYVSHYHDGLWIWDISNPDDPIYVASYDTYTPPGHESYKGAWGVYPLLPSGNILVSDMQSGLFVFAPPEQNNLELLFQWTDDGTVLNAEPNPGDNWVENIYNEIWGFVANEHEFAVIGTTQGTHIFDVTDPINSYLVASIDGASTSSDVVHRDFHTYNGYLYAVADEMNSSTLQIIDISNAPNSIEVIYDSNDIITRAHNIFIDEEHAIMYVCGGKVNGNGNYLCLLSLEDPENPVFLTEYNSHGYIHDIYVNDNIGYLNAGNNGLHIVDFSGLTNSNITEEISDQHTIFPNPCSDVLNLNSNGLKNIELYDIYGNLLLTKNGFNTNPTLELEFLKPGIYLLIMEDKHLKSEHRIIKQ